MGNNKMINNMKKILIIAATLLFSSISLIGCTKTELNVNIEGEITNIQSSGFVKICDDPISLSYDPMTRIVYIKNVTYGVQKVYTPYYAPNGLPYKYNPETNTFHEIEN